MDEYAALGRAASGAGHDATHLERKTVAAARQRDGQQSCVDHASDSIRQWWGGLRVWHSATGHSAPDHFGCGIWGAGQWGQRALLHGDAVESGCGLVLGRRLGL